MQLLLTTEVSKTDTALDLVLRDDPILANLLVVSLLETTLNTNKQKKLVLTLLKQPQQFNWLEPRLQQGLQNNLAKLIPTLSPIELKEYIKLFTQLALPILH